MTVAELIEKLNTFPKSAKIEFQGNLTLYRVEERGDHKENSIAHFEFNEMYEVTNG